MALEYSNIVQAIGTFSIDSQGQKVIPINAAGFDRHHLTYVSPGVYDLGLEAAAVESECVLTPAFYGDALQLSIAANATANPKIKRVTVVNSTGEPTDAAFTLIVTKLPQTGG